MMNTETANILQMMVATQKCVTDNCKSEYKKMKRLLKNLKLFVAEVLAKSYKSTPSMICFNLVRPSL